MGVQGLSSLLETRREVYQEVQLRRTRLVIDGSNLVCHLYYSSGLDQNCGGEYALFEDLIERFISALRTCEVKPYVVLDGPDPTDRKLETVTMRAENLIQRAHQAAETGKRKGILPQMVKMVFKQTLIRRRVPVAHCFGEADQEVAALAAEWNCPVLSNDGDFFIFDLPAGFLPITHFRWKEVKAGPRSYITCKSYTTSCFCNVFRIQRQLLPTFAALAGNDYVKLKMVNWTQFAPAGSKTSYHLEGLLCWLRDFQQSEDAEEAALGLMGELDMKRREEVRRGLYEGMKEYKPHQSCLKQFFDHRVPPLFQGSGLVPDWAGLALTQTRLTPNILDVLLLQRMFLGIAVEPRDWPSVYVISRPIRQIMYGLLLGRETSLQVTERDRVDSQLIYVPVRPAFSETSKRLRLSSLHEAELSERLLVLLETLGVIEDSLSLLPTQLKLPVAVTCFWLQMAEPPPDLTLLKALLLGMSMGVVTRPKADDVVLLASPDQGPHVLRVSGFQRETVRGIYTCQQLQLKASCWSEPEQLVQFRAEIQKDPLASQMGNHCGAKKLDVGVVYAFNQWQACLKDSVHLNQLLGFPLLEPEIARLYQGTTVHQLVDRMRSGERPEAILMNDRTSVEQYQSMLSVVQLHTHRAPAARENQQRAEAGRSSDGDRF